MRFAEKHNKKGLKEMQANNATATSARAEAVTALIKPKEVEPKIPKGNQQPQAQSTCLHCSPQARETCSCPHHQGSQALPAEGQGQGQGSDQGHSFSCSSRSGSGSGSGSGSQRCPGPHKGSRVETFIC
ncbi:hypothetical protein CB1_018864002 [Camelus ferus]|nr:hypothetical protein CB1_018864002 [Camelus ferus]